MTVAILKYIKLLHFSLDGITIFRYSNIAVCRSIRKHNLKHGLQKEVIMIRKTIKVSDNHFRKLEDPLGNESSKKYIFYAKACDVPEGIPMSTNPRDQKLTSSVATAITDSLLSNDGLFHLKNRGIILSAKRVRYDNRLQEVTLDFDDESCHGNVDGGHTYMILLQNKDKILDQYVQFEVMTGVEAMIADLAEARNTSVTVDTKTMAELREKFDPIKESLEVMPFLERIAFKQNQITRDVDTKKPLKMIDARDIVSIICMFNIEKYGSVEHPTKAYSGKQAMLGEYLEDPEHYRKFVNIIPDVFDLYEAIETEFATAYNENGRMYGRKLYSGYKEGSPVGKSKFGQRDIFYKIPDGLLYPVLASFRSLVEYDSTTDKYKWVGGKDPLTVWNKNKVGLTRSVMDLAASLGDKPTVFGKDQSLWNYAYMVLATMEGVFV